jgi:Ca2+-binding RTX toxin-like protein
MATEGTITIQGQNLRISGTSAEPGVNITGTEAPDIINGSNGNDTIAALGGDDTIFGSLGSDSVDGGADIDTIDYSSLGAPITLFPRGVLGNEDPQTSLIKDIETIIGASGQANKIDGSTATSSGGASFDINLGENKLTVNNVPNLGSLNFTVENFRDVDGTQNDDIIVGNNEANTINGNGGNDSLTGAGGNDAITGRDGNDTVSGTDSSVRGAGELDTLTGGAGGDKFILGDASGAYYRAQGDGDFASITDFGSGEQIQLGTGDTYQLDRASDNFKVFVTTGGVRDLIADVSFGSASSNNPVGIASINSADAVLADIPEGDFTIAPGQNLGVFVGA